MPNWFWPIAGIMLLIVACANFSENKIVILIAQAYIAAFHSGAVFLSFDIRTSSSYGMCTGDFHCNGVHCHVSQN